MNVEQPTSTHRKVLLTGASGYLGGLITKKLTVAGWMVTPLSRSPPPGGIPFTLGQPIVPEKLRGYDALIHAAYDFSPVNRKDIDAINVRGAAYLFDAAAKAGIQRIVAISTISAFAGCKSNYGQAKLEIEAHARAVGACVIRPGLIYGTTPGAMFGRLVSQVKAASLLPIPGDGQQLMYTVHEDDLTDAIHRSLSLANAPTAPITVANRTALSFSKIMDAIAAKLGRKITPIPVPWQAMWLTLRAAEVARVRVGLRSDSLVSLVNQDTDPTINADILGVDCRPFSLHGISLAG